MFKSKGLIKTGFEGGFVVVLACFFLTAFTNTGLSEDAKRYRNSDPKWTVIYPAKWKRHRQDSITVKFLPANGLALCCIHVLAVRYKSLKSFVDFSLAYSKKSPTNQGPRQMVRSRRPVTTQTGKQGIEVLLDFVPGGRSRRLYEPLAYVIDCETYAEKWPGYSSDFNMIQRSFDFE